MKWFRNWPGTVQKHFKLGIVAVLGVSAGVVASIVALTGVSSQTQPGRDAIQELTRGDTGVVAVVNGQAIPASKLRAYQIFAPDFSGQSARLTAREYVDMLVDNELLYQEAARRGLVPDQDEVLETARSYREALSEGMSQDTGETRQIREYFAQIEGTEYHLDAFDTSPVMLDGFRRQIAVGKLRLSLMEAMDPGDRNDLAKREEVVRGLIKQLRAASTIEFYPLPK
ncbi:MAG: hypothetical protein KJ053_09175 [Dehalococcoidia bacterium]|nr:hypothetical protein [Dehalococcoidia bacterium]